MIERPLLSHLPQLAKQVRFVELGEFPTRVDALTALAPDLAHAADAYVKRDDESAVLYGGNKVRTLEVLFGDALAKGARRIHSTGAFGSNHAAATVLHAPRVGLDSGALLFPQPPSQAARENFELVLARAGQVELLPHWSAVPFGMWRLRRRGEHVMAPGGAVPLGALGYVSAALELAEQVRSGELPEPRQIVVGVGSTCTSAGLLVGLRVARALGLAFRHDLPRVVAVRVSPWPITSPLRIARLARRTALLVARWTGSRRWEFPFAELLAGLELEPRYLGSGYGQVTPAGLAAIRTLGPFGSSLDTTYSAKSAAGFLRWLREHPGPTLYWATKSSRPLPRIAGDELAALPPSAARWLATC